MITCLGYFAKNDYKARVILDKVIYTRQLIINKKKVNEANGMSGDVYNQNGEQDGSLVELFERYAEKFPVSFWKQRLADHEAWWEGRLGRPLINVANESIDESMLHGDQEVLPYHKFWPAYPARSSNREIMESQVAFMLGIECMGDGFPNQFPVYGAGSLAAMLGARMEYQHDGDTVWFFPPKGRDSLDFSFSLDRDGGLFARIKDHYETIAALAVPGTFQMGMTDIGGTADVLASFRPANDLLMDLYDRPDDVKLAMATIRDAWKEVYSSYQSILAGVCPGSTCWAPILSRSTYYMLQCDLAYMISPSMFNEFIMPDLEDLCSVLDRPFYHLDGQGQIAHLDSLLSIGRLQGVQWIPGEGAAPIDQWPTVFRKISDAGKKIQVFLDIDNDPYQLDKIADQIGRADNIVAIINRRFSDVRAAEDLLARFY